MATKRKWWAAGGCGAMGAAGGVAAVVLLGGGLVAIAVMVPSMAETQARAFLDEQVAANLQAELAFGDVEASLFEAFPKVTVTVHDLALTGTGPFQGVPLAAIDTASVSVDAWSLLGDEPTLKRVHLVAPRFDLRVTTDGVANYAPTAGSAEESEASSMRLRLDDLTIDDLALSYADDTSGMRLALADLDLHATGAFSSTTAQTGVEMAATGLTAHATGVTWLRDAALDLDMDADLDLQTGGVTLGETRLTVNALPLTFRGSVVPKGDDLDVDLAWEAADTSFKALLSLVPAVFLHGYEGVKADGTVAASGSAKGRYAAEGDHLPAFDAKITAKNAWFQYPDLPEKVSDIDLDVAIRHPEGATDLTEVDVDRLHLAVGGAPVDLTLKLRQPVTDPFVDTTVKAKVDMAMVSQAVEGIDTKGKVDADFAVKGRMSDFEAQRVDRVTATGGVRAKGLEYRSEDLPHPVLFELLDVTFSPQRADLKAMDLVTGPTDLSVTGSLDNIWPWMLAEKPLKGDIDVDSKTLDLRPFQGDDEEASADDEAAGIVPVPTDLDMRIGCKAKRVFLDDMELTNLVTQVQVKDGVADLQTLTAGFTGGSVEMHGTYAAPTAEKADVDFTIDSVRLDAAKTMSTFDSLGRIAPVLEGTSGTFGSGLAMKARLLSDLSLDLPALVSSGNLRDLNIAMKPSVLGEVAKQLKTPDLSKVDLGGTLVKWNIEGGRMKLSPIDMKLGGTPATLRGSTGVVDQTLDLVLALPVSTKALQGAEGKLGKLAKDVGEVDVRVLIKGTYDKPKIAIEAGDAAKEVVEAAVEEVVKEVKDDALDKASDLIDAASREGDKLIAAAEEAGDALRSEAKKAADKLRKEATKQGDKLIDAAKNPVAKAAAKESKKGLEKEADKAGNKVERDADKKADGLVDEAKKQKEKLIAEARKKVDAQR